MCTCSVVVYKKKKNKHLGHRRRSISTTGHPAGGGVKCAWTRERIRGGHGPVDPRANPRVCVCARVCGVPRTVSLAPPRTEAAASTATRTRLPRGAFIIAGPAVDFSRWPHTKIIIITIMLQCAVLLLLLLLLYYYHRNPVLNPTMACVRHRRAHTPVVVPFARMNRLQ